MKHYFYFLITLLSTLLFTACSSTEKPRYILTDSKLHNYTGGDTLRYGVVSLNSDVTGTLTYTFQESDLITPTNQTLNGFTRNTQIEGGVQFSFPTPYFTQTENGDLVLEAYSQTGKTFWLSEDGSVAANTEFYPSPLSDLIEQTAINSQLFRFEDNHRSDGGDTSLQVSPLGIETVETDYATFEAYKTYIIWTATIRDDIEQKSYSLSGTQWVYPPLGVVRFEYTDFDSNAIFGTLSATNIKIAAENKVEN